MLAPATKLLRQVGDAFNISTHTKIVTMNGGSNYQRFGVPPMVLRILTNSSSSSQLLKKGNEKNATIRHVN